MRGRPGWLHGWLPRSVASLHHLLLGEGPGAASQLRGSWLQLLASVALPLEAAGLLVDCRELPLPQEQGQSATRSSKPAATKAQVRQPATAAAMRARHSPRDGQLQTPRKRTWPVQQRKGAAPTRPGQCARMARKPRLPTRSGMPRSWALRFVFFAGSGWPPSGPARLPQLTAARMSLALVSQHRRAPAHGPLSHLIWALSGVPASARANAESEVLRALDFVGPRLPAQRLA